MEIDPADIRTVRAHNPHHSLPSHICPRKRRGLSSHLHRVAAAFADPSARGRSVRGGPPGHLERVTRRVQAAQGARAACALSSAHACRVHPAPPRSHAARRPRLEPDAQGKIDEVPKSYLNDLLSELKMWSRLHHVRACSLSSPGVALPCAPPLARLSLRLNSEFPTSPPPPLCRRSRTSASSWAPSPARASP